LHRTAVEILLGGEKWRTNRLSEEQLEINIEEFIHQRDWAGLRAVVEPIPAPDLADLLKELNSSEQILLFSALSREQASDLFAELDPEERDTLLGGLTDEETRRLLADLPPDDRTQLFSDLPGEVTQRLLNLLNKEDLRETRLLLGFPEESVGRLMTPDYVAVRPDWPISRALAHIRARGRGIETISTIYVTDSAWHLLDALELHRFILEDPNERVEKVMDRSFQSLSALEDREEAVRMMERYGLYAAPVINEDGVLLGVVTVDDILEVAEEEATEDFQKVAAVTPLRYSYRNSSVWSLFTRRIWWLLALISVNLVSSSIIGAFEETLSATIALAFFIPLLMGTGGNAGIQSASLIIRALSTDDIDLTQWLPVFLKEIGEGVLLGLCTGLAALTLGFVRGGLEVGAVVGLTMMVLVVLANFIGVLLPFLLTRLNFDPAVASSPLITTLVDALGLLLYFNVARWVLG
jgi:magnesium transporter